MAGDGGRAPDVSEQRAKVWFVQQRHLRPDRPGSPMNDWVRVSHVSNPASVLAALLAEQPDATITALETLLTSEEAGRAMHVFGCETCSAGVPQRCPYGGLTDWDQHKALAVVSAACRSLRPKAPKEDRDA